MNQLVLNWGSSEAHAIEYVKALSRYVEAWPLKRQGETLRTFRVLPG